MSDSLPERLAEHRRQYPDRDEYLMRCSEADLLEALGGNEKLFSDVMTERAKRAAEYAAGRPKPQPPQRSREGITADVLARHARGESVDDISKALGLGRTLVVYITDQK